MKKSAIIVLVIDAILFGLVWQNKGKIKRMISPQKTEQINGQKENNDTFNEVAPITKKVEIKTKQEITPSPTPTIKKTPTATPTANTEPWGVAKQVDEVTWTMRVGADEKMATAQEIFIALNEYRKRYESQVLTWDTKLSDYANERAKYLNKIKDVDKHTGFNNFLEKEDGFNKLGFTTLGENISYGYKLNGVHVIEWMYAGDEPHNKNQLDNRWNYVGVGVDGLATCVIFGTGKM